MPVALGQSNRSSYGVVAGWLYDERHGEMSSETQKFWGGSKREGTQIAYRMINLPLPNRVARYIVLK